MCFAASGEFYYCADAVAIGFCAHQFYAQAFIGCRRACGFIQKKIGRTAVGGKKKVESAVVVDVGVGGAAADARRVERLAKRIGHFLKIPFAKVAEHVRRHGVFDVGLHALDVAVDVAVGDEDVRPAVEIVVEEKTAEAEREQGSATDIGARGFVDEEAFAFVVIERNHLIGKIGDEDAGGAGMIVIGGVNAHAGAGYAVFAEGDSGDDGFFGEGAVAVVAIELVGLGVVGEEEIGPAVVVVINDGDAESFGGGIGEAGFFGGVFESAVAAIVPEADGGAFEGFGRAVGFAFAVERAVEIGFDGPLNVIGDDKIELAVFVVVDPGGAGAEFFWACEASFLGDVGEGAVAVVVEEMALAESGAVTKRSSKPSLS